MTFLTFDDMKLKEIELIVQYHTDTKSWVSRNNTHHVLGISTSGREYHDFGFMQFDMDEDCIFFFNQEDDYRVNALEMGTCYVIHFTTYEPIETHSFCMKISNTAKIIQLFSKMANVKSSLYHDHRTVSDFYLLCSYFQEILLSTYAPQDTRSSCVKEYIDSHFHERNCLEEAYRVCPVSRRRMDTLFKAMYSHSPNVYLTLKRIEYAQKLLVLKNLSIQEISEMCGFNDIFYFSKVFHKYTDCSPSAFRKTEHS